MCPGTQPLAVGIFSVGMLPCGLAAGMAGALPQAGSGEPWVSRRMCSAAPPIRATPRAKRDEKLNEVSWCRTSLRRKSRHHVGGQQLERFDVVLVGAADEQLDARIPVTADQVGDLRHRAREAVELLGNRELATLGGQR